MKTIAIIDDDIHIGDMLEEALLQEGYRVLRAYSGTEALYLLEKSRPDLILLDLMLPGLSGEAVLPKVCDIPVIVVSAKTDVDDKVNLLLSGAADYVTKPFVLRELLARIQSQLRRGNGQALSQNLCVGKLSVNLLAKQAMMGSREIRLTRTEYAILKLLMENPNKAIAKSVILDRISEETPDCTETSLKIHVSNLRKKLREAGGGDCIEAVWGIGFRLLEPPAASDEKNRN